MRRKETEDGIVEAYRRDEGMMILVFAQWCVNRGLDPYELYARAYPGQPAGANEALRRAVELTAPKEEAGDIADETVLNALEAFGNDDLAFVVAEAAQALRGKRG